MSKKYIFVRIPECTYNLYKDVKINMEKDISRVVGKPMRIPMTKVFKAVVDPAINENYIQVDLKKLTKLGRRIR